MTEVVATTPITWSMISWLEAQGIRRDVLRRMVTIQVVRGIRGVDGWLEETPDGHSFMAFFEETSEDVVFWAPKTNEFATLFGRAFALGEDNITDATTYQFDANLHVYADVLSWLRDGGRGVVILDWARAFDRLRDAPRVAVTERLLPQYREWMRPRHLPELSVIASNLRIAA
jgi:hypothetical protein